MSSYWYALVTVNVFRGKFHRYDNVLGDLHTCTQ